jgi:hypothetical protein
LNRFARVHTGSSARGVIMDLILMSSLSADESGTPQGCQGDRTLDVSDRVSFSAAARELQR